MENTFDSQYDFFLSYTHASRIFYLAGCGMTKTLNGTCFVTTISIATIFYSNSYSRKVAALLPIIALSSKVIPTHFGLIE